VVNEVYIVLSILCVVCIVHEFGHVICAKWLKTYDRLGVCWLGDVSNKIKIPKYLAKIPLGVCVHTNLEKEDIFQRGVLSLSGVFTGLWVIMLIYPFITSYWTLSLVLLGYIIACSLDFVTVFQITWIGCKREDGFEIRIVDVV